MVLNNIPDYNGCGIYALIGSDGKYYIGSAKNVNRRIKSHFDCMKRVLKFGHDAFISSNLENAVIGGITFKAKILAAFPETITKMELEEIERIFIEKFKKIGVYNLKAIKHRI